MTIWDVVKFDQNGLISAIIQNADDGKVLMLGYMKRESLEETIQLGKAVFWSRSRGQRWMKGETSGHVLKVKEILIDCDGDALVLKVDPVGPTCHTNHVSCFYRRRKNNDQLEIIEEKIE